MSHTDKTSADRDTPANLIPFVVVGLMGLAFVVRWVGLGQEPLNDELYHFLAARSWLEGEGLSILPGAAPYDRGSLFTYLVAGFMALFGVSLEAARIPSLLSGVALVGVVGWWLGRSGLVLAAALAAVLLALDPELLQHSQMARFYALHGLLFFLGSIGVAAAVQHDRSPKQRVLIGLLAGVSLVMAFGLQVTTLIGLGGLALYVLLWPESTVHQWLRPRLGRRPLAWTMGILAGAIAAVGVGWTVGLIDWLVARATAVDLWALSGRDNVRFYYAWLHSHYAPFVVLFPLLVILSWSRAPRISALSFALFAIPFIVHSLLPWKAYRYLAYALPFFFILSAIGLIEGLRHLRRGLVFIVQDIGVRQNLQRWTVIGALVAVILSLTVGNRAFIETTRLVDRDPEFHFPLMGPGEGTLSWSRAEPVLQALADDAGAVVSSNPNKGVMFLDRLDYALSRTSLYQPAGYWHEEFWVDPRYGRPVIVSREALQQVVCEHDDVLVVTERLQLRNPRSILPETARFLEERGERIDLPAELGLEAFRLLPSSAEGCPP